MGYSVSVTITHVCISSANISKCLDAINAMFDPKILEENASGFTTCNGIITERSYAWVNSPGPAGFASLVSAFAEWGYSANIDKLNGNLRIDKHENEKWGDDEKLFNTIGPFVNDGGCIEILGEDGAGWRYLFNGIVTKRQDSITVWPSKGD